ncbi:hypothetical protein ACET3X_002849 [Alternaria dauci]|uniref:Uncharacterized protein n=1 Tax=Alternaria dauci TaxID=48095 RepID=A0ABR3UR78_9PLEO
MEEESSEEREESPLFEPEESRDVHIQGDMDADAVMLSPPLTSASEDLLPNGRKGRSVAGVIPRSCSKRPIIIESGSLSSNSDSHSDTGSNILVSAQPDPTTKVLRAFLDLSPLSGDCSRIDEYIDVLDKLAAKNTAMGATKQYTDELANEEASITLAIEGIPAEQKQQLAAIAQACAKGIQADMATPSIATDMSAIQAAIETSNREAEVSRQSVLDLTKKKGEELLAKRLEVRRKREDALEECKAEVKLGTQSLQETRRRLEEEGGMAMMVELGRRIERLEGAGAKNDRKASARWG